MTVVIGCLIAGLAMLFLYALSRFRATIIVVRRPTLSQAHALNVLSHSASYLIDSYVSFGVNGKHAKAELEAARILMRLNTEVFDECKEGEPNKGWQ